MICKNDVGNTLKHVAAMSHDQVYCQEFSVKRAVKLLRWPVLLASCSMMDPTATLLGAGHAKMIAVLAAVKSLTCSWDHESDFMLLVTASWRGANMLAVPGINW